MADALPSIMVTDTPSRNDTLLGTGTMTEPASTKESADGNRDDRIKSSSSNESRPLTSGKSFPTKLIRTLSGSHGGSSQMGQESPTAIDPLSQHIFQRTHPDCLSIQRNRLGEPETPEGMPPSLPARVLSPPIITRADTADSSKDKKKGVSFLSRFIGSKKKDYVPPEDDYSGPEENRAEGIDADVFSQPIGFVPRFPAPPKYIKIRSRGKKQQEFNRVFLAQELRGRTGVEIAQAGGRLVKGGTPNPSERAKDGSAIWAMEFSKDGRYLAAGGHDRFVRVWAVIATGDDRRTHEREEEAANKDGTQTRLSAPVFKSKPIYEYEGHTASILDLSWSKNNFLLSSSMDKTVRLWHASRTECLCCFKHTDFVTSIQFHPRDDRFFLAGSLDSKLRLWSIPDRSVACWTQLSDLVTAVAFSPDGKTSIAGCLGGSCQFYSTESMKFLTSMNVKSAHGKNAKGSKVTGIEAISYPPGDLNGEVKLIITTNDSRVRVYNLRDKSLELKLKGHEIRFSQIRASLSDDAKYVICGSEDRKVYIWSTGPPEKDKDKRPLEMFEAHSAIVTAAVLAPIKTRQLLQASGDPLFDLCNPPPVTLISRTESRASSSPPIEMVQPNDLDAQSTPVAVNPSPKHVKPDESPAYLARSSHPNGNIIVSADYVGRIKVFRQDCGWKKRSKVDNWDPSPTFSKKVLNRTSSIATKNSKSSRRESLNHPSSDRILSWRQSIERTNTSNDGFPSPRLTSYRSASPRLSQSQTNRTSRNALTTTPSISTLSNPSSLHKSSIDSTSYIPRSYDGPLDQLNPDNNPLMLRGDASYLFWNKDTYAEQARNLQRRRSTRDNLAAASEETSADGGGSDNVSLGALRPEMLSSKRGSDVSVLSSDSDADAERDGDGEVRCKGCGGGSFKARMRGEERALECVGCGTVA